MGLSLASVCFSFVLFVFAFTFSCFICVHLFTVGYMKEFMSFSFFLFFTNVLSLDSFVRPLKGSH